MELYFSNSQPTYAQWMRIVANSLRDNLGITDIQFRQVPASDYFSMLREHGRRARTGRTGRPTTRAPELPGEHVGLDNRMGWENKEFNDLIAKANKTADQQQAMALYNQAEDIAVQEMPMIPLWTWAGQGGRSKNVDNVTITPFSTGLVATDVTVK